MNATPVLHNQTKDAHNSLEELGQPWLAVVVYDECTFNHGNFGSIARLHAQPALTLP